MPLMEVQTGTASITTTEYSCTNNANGVSSNTTPGIIQAFIDLNGMAAGNQIEIKIYEKTRSSDTQRLIYFTTLTGVQSEPIWVSPSLLMMHGWDVTVRSTTGSATLAWSIRAIT